MSIKFKQFCSGGMAHPAGKETDTLGVMVSAKASIKALVYWSAEYCNNRITAITTTSTATNIHPNLIVVVVAVFEEVHYETERLPRALFVHVPNTSHTRCQTLKTQHHLYFR